MSSSTTTLSAASQQQQVAAMGTLEYKSGVSSSPYDPFLNLASHCLRSAFGESVQLVADTLQTRGPQTFRQLLQFLRKKQETPPSAAVLRASLLVLMQHSIVTTKPDYQGQSSSTNSDNNNCFRKPLYVFHPTPAVCLLRYARYLEVTKKAVDAAAAVVVECLLLAGRLRTVDLILQACPHVPASDKHTPRQVALEALYKLVQGGLVVPVPPLLEQNPLADQPGKEAGGKKVKTEDNGDDDPESLSPPKKKVRLVTERDETEDAAVCQLIQSNSGYKTRLRVDCVWKVNLAFFHERLRANTLGKLVHERFGHKIPAAGSLVQAALLYRAHAKHSAAAEQTTEYTFGAADLQKYMSKAALQALEKTGMSASLEQLAAVQTPPVLRHLAVDEYQVDTAALMEYLQDRITHKVVRDRHGETASRIVSILRVLGWLESEPIARYAMTPAKDTREVLHRLLKNKYVDVMPLNRYQQPHHFVWMVERTTLLETIRRQVALALWNVRLRLQRQTQVGKEWIERAQQEVDENDHETDRVEFQRFCVGLERLDHAALQLDEALIVLRNFES